MTLTCRRSLSAIAVATVALLVASCTGSPKASRSNPNALRPEAVEYKGTLTPVSGIAKAISGKTLVLAQPRVGRSQWTLDRSAIYFRADGYADSAYWLDVAWSVRGSKLCLSLEGKGRCYAASKDDTGQAYLVNPQTSLVAKVESIEPGDSHNVRAAYEARSQQEKMKLLTLVALAGAVEMIVSSGGGGSGAGAGRDPQIEETQRRNDERNRQEMYKDWNQPSSGWPGG